MSKTVYRMIGLLAMVISIFFLTAGLYIEGNRYSSGCLVTGVVLFIIGEVFYRILKSDS